MARIDRIGKHATTVVDHDNIVTVKYHKTTVFTWNRERNLVRLNSGDWKTMSTKTRINQSFNQFGLPLQVYQEKGEWYVRYTSDDATMPFVDGMTIVPLRKAATS